MSETRDFPTAVIASITSGVMLCDSFGDIHEAAEYLMGHPIWTHHFADKQLASEMQRTALEQCPGLPTDLSHVSHDNWRAAVSELERKLGKTVKVRKGSGLTAMLPTDGIPDHLGDKVIVVEVKK